MMGYWYFKFKKCPVDGYDKNFVEDVGKSQELWSIKTVVLGASEW